MANAVEFTLRVKDAATAVLKQIEQSADKLTEKLFGFKDVLKDLVAVAGAFSLAEIIKDMVELGTASDKTFRQIAANLPTFTQGIQELKEGIEDIARDSGRSIEDMQQSAAAIAKLGVSSADELQQVLNASTMLADATGASVDESSQLLIQLRREFHLTGEEALETAAKLASAAQGKVAITELMSAYQAAVPVFEKFNIDVDTGTKAIIALISQTGGNSRAIRTILNDSDAARIREIASHATVAADALDQLRHRSDEVRESMAATSQRLKNEFSQTLEDIWVKIGDKVLTPLKGWALLLDLIKEKSDALNNTQWKRPKGLEEDPQLDAALARQRAGAELAGKGKKPFSLPEGQTQLHAQEEARNAFASAIAKYTPGKSDDLEATISRLTAAATKAGLGTKEINARVADLRAAAQQAAQASGKALDAQLQVDLQAFSAGAADAYLAANQKIVEERQRQLDQNTLLSKSDRDRQQTEINEIGVRGQTVAQTLRLFDQLQLADVRAARSHQDLATRSAVLNEEESQLLAVIQLSTTAEEDRATAEHALVGIQQQRLDVAEQQIASDQTDIDRLTQQISLLQQRASDPKLSGKDRLEIETKINDYEQQIAGHQLTIQQQGRVLLSIAQQEEAARQRTVQHYQAVANIITEGVSDVLQLAQAFGAVDQHTAAILSNLAQVAAHIPTLLNALDSLSAGTGSWTAVLGAANPIVGGIASILSTMTGLSVAEDARVREAEKVYDDNTAALRQLSETLKNLPVTNQELSTLSTALGATAMLTSRQSAAGSQYPYGRPGVIADTSGLTPAQWDAIREAAKQLNITMDGTEASFLALMQAISRTRPEIAAELAEKEKEAEEDLKVRELRAKGLDAEAEKLAFAEQQQREYAKALEESGLSAVDFAASVLGMALATTQAAEAAKFAADQEKAKADAAKQAAHDAYSSGRSDLGQRFQILGTSADDQLLQTSQYYGKQNSAFASLYDGLDLTKQADIDEFNRRVKEFYKGIDDGTVVVDTSVLSLEDWKSACVDLSGAATSAAAAFETAAQKISDAESHLQQDFDVFGTDAKGKVGGYAGAYGIDISGFDLTSKSGVDAFIAYFQDQYKNAKDDLSRHEFQTLIDNARGINFAPDSISGLTTGAISHVAGPVIDPRSLSIASAFTGVTTIQADRMGDYLLHINEGIVGVNMRLDKLIDQGMIMKVPTFAPVNFGAIAQTFGAAGGGSAPLTVNLGSITVNAGSAESAQEIVDEAWPVLKRKIETELGRSVVVNARYNGDISVRPS